MPVARHAPIELGRYVLVPSRGVKAMLENTSARRERVPVAQARSVLHDAFRSPSARSRIFEAYRSAVPSRHVTGATRQALADSLAWVLRAVSTREPEYVLLRQAPPPA